LIENRVKYLKKDVSSLTHLDILNGFKRSGLFYGYSHFNPLWFKWFLNKFNVKICYDPTGGWGHRLLGALNIEKYIYNDLSMNTKLNVDRIIDFFKIKNVDTYCKDAKTFTPDDNFDAMFTCPPYFNVEKYECEEINIVWNRYIDLAKKQQSTIYDILNDNLDMLNNIMQKGNEAIKNMPDVLAICHNDLDSKNVLWLNDEFKLIDLECLDYSNPYLELYELALCWSGYEKCNINFDLFKCFFDSYFNNTELDTNIDWESIYYANNGRLEWLEFNIKRSLMIDCDTKEEQEIGINEVKETIEHVVYYDKVKNDILVKKSIKLQKAFPKSKEEPI
jgi:thiamine kinase-like enzyme